MSIIPAQFSGPLLSLLRFVTGLLFLEHGSMKLLNFPPSDHPGGSLGGIILVAGLLELIGGALVTVGLFTRVVAFVLSGEMAVAYFTAHFPHSFYPAINQGDAAILFCFVFLYLAAAGAGPISIDAKLGGMKAKAA